MDTVKERVSKKSYAAGFEELLIYIDGLLPRSEIIGQALRQEAPVYPSLEIRDLVANALIHKEFLMNGAGPPVEIFEDRIKVANPGAPLVSTDCFVDTPPRSRNEELASLMRLSPIKIPQMLRTH